MKKAISLFLSCLLCINVLAGCSSKGTGDGSGIRIYLTVSQADTFRSSLIDAAA